MKRIGRCHPWGGCGHDPVPAKLQPPLSCMDRKSIIILVVCFILLMLWYPLVVNKLYPPKPLPPGATNAPAALMATTNQRPHRRRHRRPSRSPPRNQSRS